MKVLRGVINRNKEFLFSLDKTARATLFALVLLHFSFGLYYLLTTPLHYDEWHSLKYFSDKSFWTIISYYPAPNNHVFYNLVARFFLLTGAEGEIGVRVPALLASVLTVYYFFKLCKQFFTSSLSLFLLSYVIVQFPFIDYSFLARGYGFLNLFCVLMMYSSLKLSENYSDKRYRVLFILSQCLGLYTVPSFLYALPVLYIVLTFYVLSQGLKPFRLFIADCLTCMLLVAFLYAFIFFNNDLQNLLNPNGGSNNFSIDDPDFKNNLIAYFNSLFFELFRLKGLLYFSLVILITVIYKLATEKYKPHYGLILSALMFFSPVVITLIHHVHAFSRNWLFLIFPMVLCFGFSIQSLFSLVKVKLISEFFRRHISIIYFIILTLVFFQLVAFGSKRREEYRWDYQLNFLRKVKLKPLTQKVRSIGKTEVNLEYYAAEEIMFFCQRKYHDRWIQLTPLTDTTNQDILVIHKKEQEKYRRKLLSYNFLYNFDEYWIYLKKEDLKTLN